MGDKVYMYIDFTNYKTEEEVTNMILKRKVELKARGYNDKQIFEIIFKDSYFRNGFLFDEDYMKIKTKFNGY